MKRILPDGSEDTSGADLAAPGATVPAAFDMPYFSASAAADGSAGHEEAGVAARSTLAVCPIFSGGLVVIGDTKGDGFVDGAIWIGHGWDTGWYDGEGSVGEGNDGGTDDEGTYAGGIADYSSTWTTAVGDINGDGIQDSLRASYDYDAQGNFS